MVCSAAPEWRLLGRVRVAATLTGQQGARVPQQPQTCLLRGASIRSHRIRALGHISPWFAQCLTCKTVSERSLRGIGPKLEGPRGFSSSGSYHPETKSVGDSRSGVLPAERKLLNKWELGGRAPASRGAWVGMC